MSFTEWSNAKKKKREETSSHSAAVTETSSTSGINGSGSSNSSFAEWSDAKMQKRASNSAQRKDDYQNHLAQQEKNKQYAAYDLEAGKKEITDMEARLQELLNTSAAPSPTANGRPYAVSQQPKSYPDSYRSVTLDAAGRPYAVGQQPQIMAEPDEVRELKEQLARKKQEYTLSKRCQESMDFDSAVNNADFDKYSAFADNGDDLYNWINDQQFRKSYEAPFQRNGVQSNIVLIAMTR